MTGRANFFLIFIYLLFISAVLGLSCGTRDPHCGMWAPICGMRALSCGMHVGSSSPTRDRTQAPRIGSAESPPLGHQGSPW